MIRARVIAPIIAVTVAIYYYLGVNSTAGFDWYTLSLPAVAGYYVIAYHVFVVAKWYRNHCRIAPSPSFFTHRVRRQRLVFALDV